MATVIAGIFVGAMCGLFRLRVFVLVPVSAILAVCSVASGIIAHADLWTIVIAVPVSLGAVQLAYAAVSLMLNFLRLRAVVPEMQAAIGQRLRAELEVPQALPPELSALVARLPLVDDALRSP
jgi:hypothetical protein